LRCATFHTELACLALGESEHDALRGSREGFSKSIADFTVRLLREPMDAGDAPEGMADPLRAGPTGLSGSSSVISVPEIVGMLQIHEKSGLLRVVTKTETIFMGLENGDLVYAYSDNSPPGFRLGQILVDQGAIDQARLNAFLAQHSADQGKLGEALERGELVTKEALRQAIEYQAQQLFFRAQESSAFYSFTPGEPATWGFTVRVAVVRLLLESARLQDEALRVDPIAGTPSREP
jgi:hypothetical protein